MPKPIVTLYTKKGCCLCDEAKAVIETARAKTEFELETVDIESDAELLKKYGEQIPVIFVNGRKAFKFRVDKNELIKKLLRETSGMKG